MRTWRATEPEDPRTSHGPVDELITLETDGWRALSADGAAAIEFPGRLLDESAVMLLPGEAWRLVFHQGTPR